MSTKHAEFCHKIFSRFQEIKILVSFFWLHPVLRINMLTLFCTFSKLSSHQQQMSVLLFKNELFSMTFHIGKEDASVNFNGFQACSRNPEPPSMQVPDEINTIRTVSFLAFSR